MPKYYCEYCGIYLTHSSPSGRKQHSHGRKHIQSKVEYYSQFLLESHQTGKGPFNPFMKPGMGPMGFLPLNLPRPIIPGQAGVPPGMPLAVPTINMPGIQPSNITSIPIPTNANPGGYPGGNAGGEGGNLSNPGILLPQNILLPPGAMHPGAGPTPGGMPGPGPGMPGPGMPLLNPAMFAAMNPMMAPFGMPPGMGMPPGANQNQDKK